MAKQQKMYDEDSLKRRARRRLIGAVALTTVVVVVLPMVLDKEPRPIDQNIELRIPDKNSAGEFNPKMEPAPVNAPAAVSNVPEAVAESAIAPDQGKTDQAKSASKPLATAKPAAKPVGETLQTDVQSGFVVQVGAYSSDQAAHDMQKKLGQQGVKAYIEKTGNISRVRVGPFKTREEADKVHSMLEAQGLKPIVTPSK
jgi:DedD protein